MKLYFPILLVTLLISSSCLHMKVITDVIVKKDNLATFSVGWIKDKGKKFDILIQITNHTKQNLIGPISDMSCSKGDLRGTISRTSLSHEWLTTPGQTIKFNLTCYLGVKTEGSMTVNIHKVYSIGNNEPNSARKDLMKDIVLKVSPEQASLHRK